MGIIEIIEAVAAVLWLGLGIYVSVKARRVLRRVEQTIADIEKGVYL